MALDDSSAASPGVMSVKLLVDEMRDPRRPVLPSLGRRAAALSTVKTPGPVSIANRGGVSRVCVRKAATRLAPYPES